MVEVAVVGESASCVIENLSLVDGHPVHDLHGLGSARRWRDARREHRCHEEGKERSNSLKVRAGRDGQ